MPVEVDDWIDQNVLVVSGIAHVLRQIVARESESAAVSPLVIVPVYAGILVPIIAVPEKDIFLSGSRRRRRTVLRLVLVAHGILCVIKDVITLYHAQSGTRASRNAIGRGVKKWRETGLNGYCLWLLQALGYIEYRIRRTASEGGPNL